jgi:predicted transcriptional regulator
MSSYTSLVSQAAGYRIALHHERKAHKAAKHESKKIIKHLQDQLDNKQAFIETLLERNVDLEERFWSMLDRCPALQTRVENDEAADEVVDEVDEAEEDDEDDDEAEDEEDDDDDNSDTEPCPYYRRK